ncbi:MAG: hypothetical protein ACRDL0_04720, partial [Thermoleophilaceae bacterium]
RIAIARGAGDPGERECADEHQHAAVERERDATHGAEQDRRPWGAAARGVADGMPEQISALVYLDAFVPSDGESSCRWRQAPTKIHIEATDWPRRGPHGRRPPSPNARTGVSRRTAGTPATTIMHKGPDRLHQVTHAL